jgi:hypothetical protein
MLSVCYGSTSTVVMYTYVPPYSYMVDCVSAPSGPYDEQSLMPAGPVTTRRQCVVTNYCT